MKKRVYLVDEEYEDCGENLYSMYVNVIFLDEGDVVWDDELLDLSFDDVRFYIQEYLLTHIIIPCTRTEFDKR